MQAFSKLNRGVKYLLAVIDILSKYGWLIPLKDKTGKSVASALKTIFKERKPEKMWVDKGKEFYNKDVKDLVELYSTENEEKSSVVERWIRTMKEKMWKYFTDKNTNIYIDILPDLVKNYNNTRHSSIKMTPVKASKKENELTVWRNLYPEHLEIHDINPKFSVGDRVRISKKKKTFEKGYTTRWTEEIFTIVEVKRSRPPTYKIADLNGEEIKGSFYEPELQKTSQEIFRIEKVIKRGKKKSLVKWKGYSDDFNSWVDNRNSKYFLIKNMISIKNVIYYPNKPLNNFELEEASKKLKIKCFRGVFLLDTLPKKLNKKECGIVNFDKSGGSGTHWVAWYKNGKNKIYFDSYGIQPPVEVINYLGKPIHYNTDQVQPRGEVFCGHLCLYVLKELNEGKEFQNILNKFF